jgi:hypothetical protein
MTDKSPKHEELHRAGERAAYAAEIAAMNIRKYNELHSNTFNKFVMKVADEMLSDSAQLAEQSVEVATRNLQKYLELRKSNQ